MTDQSAILELSRDVATVTAQLNSHLNECGRRYEESSKRLERIFEFIQTAHTDTNQKIESLEESTSTKIDNLQTSITNQRIAEAEQRGGRRMAKAIWGGAVLVVGGIGGALVELFKKS